MDSPFDVFIDASRNGFISISRGNSCTGAGKDFQRYFVESVALRYTRQF
jgi:hypothetical protein